MKDIEQSKVYRLLYPAVPVVVAARYAEKVSAMPVASAVSLSNDPPLVGFSSLAAHATCKTVTAARSFSMAWLDRRYAREMERLGRPSVEGVDDKLASAGLAHHSGRTVGVPVIDSASAVLECVLVQTLTMGDHLLLVGQVRAAYASEDFQEYWQFKGYRPILYTGSQDGFGVFDRPTG